MDCDNLAQTTNTNSHAINPDRSGFTRKLVPFFFFSFFFFLFFLFFFSTSCTCFKVMSARPWNTLDSKSRISTEWQHSPWLLWCVVDSEYASMLLKRQARDGVCCHDWWAILACIGCPSWSQARGNIDGYTHPNSVPGHVCLLCVPFKVTLGNCIAH